MTKAPHLGARLEVDADLRLSVDGVPVRITGHGSTLVVRTSRPVAVARRLHWARRQWPVGVLPPGDVARQVVGAGLRVRVGRDTGPTVLVPMSLLGRTGGGVVPPAAVPRGGGAGTADGVGRATGAVVVLLVVVLGFRRWRRRRSG